MLWATRLIAIILAALSLGMSFAHLLQMPPRLLWSPQLWMAATNFGGLYALFGTVGAGIDVAAVLAAVILTVSVRGQRAVFWQALIGAILLGVGLVCWFTVVLPVNEVMAGWTQEIIPDDFQAMRSRWETAHAVIAGIKFAAFVALVISVLDRRRTS